MNNNQTPSSNSPKQNQNKQPSKSHDNTTSIHKKSEGKEAGPSSEKKGNGKSNGNSKPSTNANGNTNSDTLNEDHWKVKLQSAKQQWSKLQQEELLASGGDTDQLSSLVQKRYSMNKADADQQVSEFFNKH